MTILFCLLSAAAGFVFGILFGRKNKRKVEKWVDDIDALDLDDKAKAAIKDLRSKL